jgi:hypothetical protein
VHYLLTIATTGGCHVHAYLIAVDPRYVERTAGEMIDEAERRGIGVMPMVLFTELRDAGRDAVRDMLARLSPDVADLLKSATDFHRSIWVLSNDHPGNEQLLALH